MADCLARSLIIRKKNRVCKEVTLTSTVCVFSSTFLRGIMFLLSSVVCFGRSVRRAIEMNLIGELVRYGCLGVVI